ncbi:hypothetical protein Pmani_012892 [Petrolisthes manimaculis]|uniref:Kinesin motor domain-containing protein n=1 Tax=Petrolisthes manimaculis TaxID=1843537 RepID=A0AAE1UE59_9EUCA|nr:hypothetical protein Pmani_012892 [Petrolisthes manimaculis]
MVVGHYQTGKSRLVLGKNREVPGLLSYSIRHITQDFKFFLSITVSAYEVYTDSVKDLLKVRANAKPQSLDEFVMRGWAELVCLPVLSDEDLDLLVTRLWSARRTLPEDHQSSGSHLVVRVVVPSPLLPGKVGTLHLVDMAGFRTEEDKKNSSQSADLRYINLTYKTLYQTLSGKTPDQPWPLLRLLHPSVFFCCIKLADKQKANHITLSNFCRKRIKK